MESVMNIMRRTVIPFSQANVAATVTESMVDNTAVHTRADGADRHVESFTAFTSNGATLNATTSNGTARARGVLFIQGAAASGAYY